jgi:ADP-ribose pyrophosphatase
MNPEKHYEASALHIKSRTEKGAGYPNRFPVPDEKVSWDSEYPEYQPPYYVDPIVISNDESKNEKGWAHPEDIHAVDKSLIQSHENNIRFDAQGYPLNPHGRTGIAGRGLLGKWGANFAADPIITYRNDLGEVKLLVIHRVDTREWALPGGMVDKGEILTRAASRELKEETGVDSDLSTATKIYEGYVDDPRNTDNAWMESAAYHFHLSSEQAAKVEMQAGDDADDAQWVTITDEFLNKMYASHSSLVRLALKNH